MNRNAITILVILIAVVLVVWYVRKGGDTSDTPGDGVVCTMEAKQCPDGTYVGRTGPNCEFAPCSLPSPFVTAIE